MTDERKKSPLDDPDDEELKDLEELDAGEELLDEDVALLANDAAPAPPPAAPVLVRLNKLLAERGVAPRRRCDELIASGAVQVNGEVASELGIKVDPESARITVDGKWITAPPRVVYALHKPKGVVCTSSPEERRMRAIDLVRDPYAARLFCVGRLDAESEGLILLTNDGDLANRISHPRYEVSKTYFVKVRGRITPEAVQKSMEGIWLAEGRTAGARIYVRKRLATASVLLVTVREGMNREIRRVFARINFPVIALKRVAIGPISLRGIHHGAYRRLTREEVASLLAVAAEPTEKVQRPKSRPKPKSRRPFMKPSPPSAPFGAKRSFSKPDRNPHASRPFQKKPRRSP